MDGTRAALRARALFKNHEKVACVIVSVSLVSGRGAHESHGAGTLLILFVVVVSPSLFPQAEHTIAAAIIDAPVASRVVALSATVPKKEKWVSPEEKEKRERKLVRRRGRSGDVG